VLQQILAECDTLRQVGQLVTMVWHQPVTE
jgi:hypothetical protein